MHVDVLFLYVTLYNAQEKVSANIFVKCLSRKDGTLTVVWSGLRGEGEKKEGRG